MSNIFMIGKHKNKRNELINKYKKMTRSNYSRELQKSLQQKYFFNQVMKRVQTQR